VAKAKTTKQMFGRDARSGLEQQAASITPDLTFQTEAQKKAIQKRSDQLQQGIARRAGLEGSGLSTGMSGQNIRLMGTIGAQQLAEESAVEQRAGGEQRANLQSLLGAQSMEDQRALREKQFGLQGDQFEEGKRQFGVGERERTRQFEELQDQFGTGTGERTRQFEEGKRVFDAQQALRAQESMQQFGLQKEAQTEAEISGAAQRRLSEGQLTGQLSDTLDREAVLQAYMEPDGGFNWDRATMDGIVQDPVTGEFTRRTGTLSQRAQQEAEASGAAQRRLGEAQLTGTLEGEGGEADELTLAGQQQEIAAEQAQGQLELAERQRQDARNLKYEELGLQSADLTERARQFDADLLERSSQFQDSYNMSSDQFLENKRQFDSGIAIEDQKVANQMNQFNAEQRLRAAQLFGGEGVTKLEFANSFGTKTGDTGYRRDLDFNKDNKIDAEDESQFDSLADADGIIRGRGTLEQRETELKQARFETEADLQSEALQIDRDKIKNVFDAQKDSLDFTMAQFNTAFTGQLYEAGPDGSIAVTDIDGNPITSTAEKVARNNLERLEDAMDETMLSIAIDMGLVGGDSGKNSISDLSDEKVFSLVSLVMANRAPASSSVGYSGGFNKEQPSGWMQALGILGQTAGSVFQGRFGKPS
tara:strand:+ start:2586 stop:4526 length:1941 start_codon:yes stop_codon:yes gene_type:complete